MGELRLIEKGHDTPLPQASENTIASAPGDLPMPDVSARFSALAWQFRHDNTIEPLAPKPGEDVVVTATSGAEMSLQRAALYYTIDGGQPHTGSTALPLQAAHVEWQTGIGFITTWSTTIPGQAAGTVVRYRIAGWRRDSSPTADKAPDVWAGDGQGFWFRFPGKRGISTFAYSPEPARRPLPEWMNDAVIYHIFLDRFHPGTPDGGFAPNGGAMTRHGGTIAGVRQALPYLVELGITCLWFSPLGPSETYHRYDTIDYFNVDPELGTIEELRDLVHEAHDLGIRTWLDFVPSHSSWRHPAFVDAQRDRFAPTYSWYTFNSWPHDYRNFMQSSRYLPSFDTQDPGARNHLIQAASHWLQACDVDGYRIDHVIAAGMDFWLALRLAAEAVKHDVALVGEATDTPDCLRRYRGHLHGILDFPLARALRLTFGTGTWTVAQFDAFLTAYETYMAEGPGTVSFLDNHDMDRFLWVAGNDVQRLKLAAVCQFTLGATPVVYYGTEIGMTQRQGSGALGFGGDAEARRDMIWDRNAWHTDLLEFYQCLIKLRRQEVSLQTGDRQTVHLDRNGQTYAYVRHSGADRTIGTALLVVFNLNTTEQTLELTLPHRPDSARSLLHTAREPRVRLEADRLTLNLDAMSAAILRI